MTINATDETFATEVLQSEIPTLVDFWAPWCGPCKTLAPTFDASAAAFEGRVKFVKVNIDETEIAAKYGVRGIPTLKMFNTAGEVVGTLVGAQTQASIAKLVEEQL